VELASSMAPSLLGGRKRKRGRREWDEGGSSLGARSIHESTDQRLKRVAANVGRCMGHVHALFFL
jgi:hypothetical protein